MKKYLSLILALCLCLALCACSGGDTDTDKDADKGSVYSPDYGELYFVSGDLKFGVMDYADEVMNSLGSPSGSFENQSCAYQGTDMVYYYDGFELTTHELDGKDRVIGIKLTDDTVQTPQGLKIGMSKADCESVLDELGGEMSGATVYKATCGSTALVIGFGTDNCISSIEYAVLA